MRYLSLFLPRLATDRVARLLQPPSQQNCPPAAPEALVTVAKVKGAYRLAALDLCAARLGLKIGMALADARAMYLALAVHDADPAAEADALRALVDWCRLFTPLAALDAPDGAMLDVTGATHLFGGETALLDTLTARLQAQGFAARPAIAGSPGAAWALARYGGTRRLIPADALEVHRTKVFAAMPLAALRLDDRAVTQFGQAGLRRVGDLLLRPRAPIAARFGPDIYDRLDALFERGRPISPTFEAPAFVAERRFAEGIVQREAIEATILALATDLCGLLARHGEGARQLDVSLFRVDGVVKHIDAGTSRPLRDPAAMARLFRERLESIGEAGLDTGYGFDVIRLAALSAERLDQSQPSWDAAGTDAADLADLIDRLGARFGLSRVTRLVPQDTHVPERAAVASAAASKHAAGARPLPPSGEGLGMGVHQSAAIHVTQNNPLPERPIRLLQPPEPIQTIAGLPDSPPVSFRWRRVLHQVAAIEGPERIAAEWWKSTLPTRDYFRAEDTAGQRFWLFREGLYQDTAEPRWFMHGLFA
ncbi:DNA polymerase Y family protein [Beijerinckia sp. L45]|uniref:Y-family DNA polymerase n=1 Tax=Beijerinckia sp. L45 TaxID=1641855 RepID=UPI001FEF0775|nr:DNA polymerase Y family protein [Beijerinckia sp. L45]